MTVKQWRDELSKYDDDTDVVLLSEEGARIRCFDVTAFSLQKGTPSRDRNNKPQFSFDSNGSTAKLFISVTQDF
jgi:hypothetical protein